MQAATVDRQNGTPAFSRRARRLDLAAPGVQAREADRAKAHRHRDAFAEKLGGKVDVGGAGQHALAQGDVAQVLTVTPQGLLVVGTAVDIFEQEAGQAAARGFAVVVDRCGRHAAVPSMRCRQRAR